MSSNGTATDAPRSSAAPPPSPTPTPAAPSSQAPPPAASSNPPPAASSAPAPAQSSAAAPPPSSAPPQNTPIVTVTAPSAAPSETVVQTILITPTPSRAGEIPSATVVVITVTPSAPVQSRPANAVGSSRPADPSSTDPTQLQGARKENAGGLSTGGKTAIAVVIPLVVVALLVLGALFFWRKRKQRKTNEDERRKEVEEYGFNPNHDPTLPAVGTAQMAEDSSGYRGWGNTATSSGRKASTTLTSGMTYSDSNSNPGGYISPDPHSPTNAYSDANSNDPLVNGRRETLDADGIAALGAGPAATTKDRAGVARGPSNASSSYSAANHSDNSGEYPGMSNTYEQGYGSYQEGPYGGPTGGQPVIRDVSARRNTRIENPTGGVFPQGNSGVATNF